MKIFKVKFKGVWPVGNCCIIAARNTKQARYIASKTLYTSEFKVNEVDISEPCVIEYLSGDY